MRELLIICILLGTTKAAFAQSDENPNTKPQIFALKSHYGFIIPHRKNLKSIAQSTPMGLQLEWTKQHITQKAWDYCGCYPRIGYTFNYTNFGSPEVLGNSYAATAFIEPFITYKGKFHPSFRLGIGLTYLDNVYDATTNPDNLFYSYPLSFFVHADLNFRYKINQSWNVTLGATYPHISNGGVSQPNKGINFPIANIGVEYKPEPVKFIDRVRKKSIDDIHNDRWYFIIQPFFTRKDVVEHQEKYNVGGLTTTLNHVIGRLSALNLGVEVYYDGSVREKQKRYNDDSYNPYVTALIGGHDLLMGKFTLSTQVGYYFTKPDPEKHDLYQRIGFQYQLTKQLLLGTSLKVHTSVADFVDFRVGVKL